MTLTKAIDAAGALVAVQVGVIVARAHLLRRHGFPVPTPVAAEAQLDTGSFITLIDVDIAQALGITPFRKRAFYTASTGTVPHVADEFDVSIAILAAGNILRLWPFVSVLGTVFTPNDAQRVILGRDLLADCVLHYDGPANRFDLTV
jgi:hypothetical protein